MRRQPLEMLLINGIDDLATPYCAASWTMNHMGLPPDLRDDIAREDFAAGHMTYGEEKPLPQVAGRADEVHRPDVASLGDRGLAG